MLRVKVEQTRSISVKGIRKRRNYKLQNLAVQILCSVHYKTLSGASVNLLCNLGLIVIFLNHIQLLRLGNIPA